MGKINTVQISGISYSIEDSEATKAVTGKQDTLISGTNIKTINNESILGSGNIDIQGGGSSYTAGDGIDITNNVISVTGKVDTSTYETYTAATDTAIAGKQDILTGGDGIDINNDVISVTGKADTSAVTAIQDSLSGYVTTDTEQIISGRKIFTYSAGSSKAIEFKQTDGSSKVGFRVRTSAASNNELASFEFRPNTFTIDNVQHPLLYFGHYRNTNTAAAGIQQTVIGFRQYDQLNAAAYHYLMPLPEKAKTPFSLTTSFKDYYAPMGFKNGSTMITADDTGVVDLSSEFSGKVDTSTYNTLSGTVTAHTADTTIHVTSTEKATWNAKSDFSGSYNDLTNKLSAGTNISIVDNVISAEGGGGKAISGGTNISITTGETADTINCTLPIKATSNVFNTISVGQGSGGGSYNTLIGANAKCDTNNGHNVFLVAQKSGNSASGAYVNGQNNVIIGSMKDGYLNFGIPSFTTSRSVVIGGGGLSTDKDNSVAIGYNANVSGTTKTNINNQLTIDTSNQVYIYNKDNTEMICLQDQLGGGGSSYTAGDGIDITNDVISVTGKADTSAVTEVSDALTAHTADTTIHVTSSDKSSWNGAATNASNAVTALGGLSLVKLTQAQYDALATKDSNTLYVING